MLDLVQIWLTDLSIKMSWYSLPCEIRRMILNTLIKDESRLSSYASVCREWQYVIEQSTFRQLKVTPLRLHALEAIACSRTAFVRLIKFSIPLPKYDCSQCAGHPSAAWEETDMGIIGIALRVLFEVLSAWHPSSRGLTLDIAIYSPSDMEHYHKDSLVDDAQDLQHRDIPLTDKSHGWINSRQVSLPPEPAIWRLFQHITLIEDFWDALPQVPAVTGLQLRRQTRRQWNTNSLQQLLSYLPALQTIFYEPWTDYALESPDSHTRYFPIFKSLSSSPMTEVVVFEDFNKLYDGMYSDVPWMSEDTDLVRQRKTEIVSVLGQASLGLERLSASFVVDAKYFFGTCSATWAWNKLCSLALTSLALAPSDGAGINKMLGDAAVVATRMPRLNVMVLWNHVSDECVGAFIYEASTADRWAKVVWRATWDISFQPSVIQLWSKIALERTSSQLLIIKEVLESGITSEPLCNAIVRLKFPCEVVHQDSLQQMQQEVLYRVAG